MKNKTIISLAAFEGYIKNWFIEKNANRIMTKDILEIYNKLDYISSLKDLLIMEFEDGSGIENLSKIKYKKNKILAGYEEFEREGYFNFHPIWLFGYYDPLHPFKNFISINSKSVIMNHAFHNAKYSINLGGGILIIYPKGSDYQEQQNKKFLFKSLKGYSKKISNLADKLENNHKERNIE